MAKNRAAVALGKRRAEKFTSETQAAAASSAWDKLTEAERAERIAKMVAARKKKPLKTGKSE